MKPLIPVVAVVLAALFAAPAQAQMMPRTVEVDVGGSAYIFVNRGGFSAGETVKSENLRDTASLDLRLAVHFAEFVAFEASLGFAPTATWDTWRRTFYIQSHYGVVFSMPTPYVVPYAVVGAGFQHYNIRPTLVKGQGAPFEDVPVRDPYEAGFDAEGNTFYRDIDEPYRYRSFDGDFVVAAGAGVKFLPVERFGVRFDVRWLMSVGPGGEEDGIPTLAPEPVFNDLFHHVQIGGSAFVLLGGGIGPDADKDGVPNRDDACRDEPEDADGFQDEDGCPDPDNDGDGVKDDVDKCPAEAEDRDGFEDDDGCPDLDNDGDGLADGRDECPTKPEDDDGFEDKDGCPDLDNDVDGLLDAEDQCPNAPENFNSYLDTDGCPDEIPGDLREFAGAIPAIQFEVGSARLKRSALPLLKKAGRALQRYGDLRVEIQGHASSEGDDQLNMELSQGRVETVREFLIAQGIDPDRLVARGYGETKPIADNATEAGRRANRRVEFKLFR